MTQRIYLSPPHMSGLEPAFVADAFASNWIAPLGPHVDAFEREFAGLMNGRHSVALSSGTAAIHLALQLVGVQRDDVVLASTFTFAATVNPALYIGATPHFVDSEQTSWNMDPNLLADALAQNARRGCVPAVVVVVHLYGQAPDMDAINEIVRPYEIPVIEDTAEALGATYKGRPVGLEGAFATFSFNGNKIITTSGGGMLVCESEADAARARKLATQSREPVRHYEHVEVGYNYRLSNVLAGIGRGQLTRLEQRVAARRRNFDYYAEQLGDLPGLAFMPEAPWGRASRWLTCITIDPASFGVHRDVILDALEAKNIEARPLWKPMHAQPVFKKFPATLGGVSDELFECGICLPSGSAMTETDLARVVDVVRNCCPAATSV